ncbi:hypothetical protein [Cognatilysobacter bugurensis]|uniref:Secreted protein n=1 Tax=Cognatilysobacter bugurensis TaxID=543356 RepID=A0A918T3E4_9GAMM|nr:hypothetical protein [Lysobacter bugurensis]GHA86110.1 hypothetical protein GCM10007067_25200 [Lysobacter bugurensis]
MTPRRTAFAAITAAALLLTSAAAFARGHYDSGPVEVDLVDRDRGYVLPQYLHRGQRWVPGTPGHRYAVRLTNHSPERVLVVLSVDGVNAMSGDSAAVDQGGYVLEPWQSTEVAGWRKSMRDVAQFYFSDPRDSYAARTGRPYDVGVIGVAVFEEARRYYAPPRVGGYRERPIAQSQASEAQAPEAQAEGQPAQAPAPADAPEMAGSRAQSIGTGHGYREYAPVRRTGFVRASRHPVQVTQLRYEDERALLARGIVPQHYDEHRYDRHYDRRRYGPQAFPGGFVPDPPRRW